MSGRPPSLASWLVSRATPPEDRDPLLGDLEEEYQRLLEQEGPTSARRFYWREALHALGPGLKRRLSARFVADAVPHGPLRRRGGSMLDAVRLDLRLAARTLLRHPRLSAAVVLTIAVGIAANTAVFAVVDAVVLRPFPFPEPERLVTLGTVIPKLRQELTFFENLSPAEYLDIARECRTLERVVAWDMATARSLTRGRRRTCSRRSSGATPSRRSAWQPRSGAASPPTRSKAARTSRSSATATGRRGSAPTRARSAGASS